MFNSVLKLSIQPYRLTLKTFQTWLPTRFTYSVYLLCIPLFQCFNSYKLVHFSFYSGLYYATYHDVQRCISIRPENRSLGEHWTGLDWFIWPINRLSNCTNLRLIVESVWVMFSYPYRYYYILLLTEYLAIEPLFLWSDCPVKTRSIALQKCFFLFRIFNLVFFV